MNCHKKRLSLYFMALALVFSLTAKEHRNKNRTSKTQTIKGDLKVKGNGTFCGNLTAKDGLTVYGPIEQNHISRPLTKKDVKRRCENGTEEEQFDVIIVGAGTSGSLLAFRLAERYPDNKILVLDVGQDDVRVDQATSAVPNPNEPGDEWGQFIRGVLIGFGEGCAQWQNFIKTSTDDQFFRVPIHYARGATLGGTSAINLQVFNRGTKAGTYDRWVAATDDPEFGFDAMTEAYKKIEKRDQTTRFFGSPPIPYWAPVGPTPGQTLNEFMGTDGRMFLTSLFLPGYTSRALNEVVSEEPLPGRTAPLPINLADVDPANPLEYGVLMPSTNYDQSDPNFPTNNPYPPTTPGTTYVPPNDPGNAKGPEFAGDGPKTLRARCYAAPAYLYPILDNTLNGQPFNHNVTIKQRVYVTKLLFDEKDPTEVIGVEYVEGPNGEGWHVSEINRAIQRNVPPYKGTLSDVDRSKCSFDAAVDNQSLVTTKQAFSKTDVWLCAGALMSPAIMQLSGIGSRQLLESLRFMPVPCRVDLPGVGNALQDTLDMAINFFTEVDLSTGLPAPLPAALLEVFYPDAFAFADPTNPLDPAGTASISGAALSSFFGTWRVASDPSKKYNDADILVALPNIGLVGNTLYQDQANIQAGLGVNVDAAKLKPVFDRARWGMYSPVPNNQYLHQNGLIVEYWDLASQGSVQIQSGNVFEQPNYAPNKGAHEDDVEAMAKLFTNTVSPMLQRAACKRFGPRGLGTYVGTLTNVAGQTLNLDPALIPLKPIVGNIDQSTYDQANTLAGFTISIVAGPGAGQNNVITSWSGAPTYKAQVLVPWAVDPVPGSVYFLNPPGSTPVESVEFADDNHRNFVRFANPNGDELFSSVILTELNNPFTTQAGSTRVRVTQPNHGFSKGDMIRITGVQGPVDTIAPENFNEYHVVDTVIDENNYDIILFWNLTPTGGPGSTSMPSPAANAQGANNVGGTVTVHTLRFDEAKFRMWLMDHFFSGWHACCSNRMGKADDLDAVVDTRARVYCTKGLRVCDCSIFPTKPNANTQAPAYGIAQKLFDLVSVEEYDQLLSS